MASTAKPTGTKRNASSSKKPATIDLDAKEVTAEAEVDVKASSAIPKTGQSTDTTSKQNTAPNKDFGRPNSQKADDAVGKSDQAKKMDANKSDSKKEAEKPAEKKAAETKAEKPTPKKDTPQPAAPAKNSGSFFGKLTSAFMGGVAALVGFGAIGLWEGARELPIIGNFYGGGGSQTETISQADFDSLKAEIASLKAANTANTTASNEVTSLAEKLTGLEASVGELSNATGETSALNEKIGKLEQDFDAVNTSIAEITAAAADGSNTSPAALSTAISSLDGRIETIEASIEAVESSVTKNPALDAVKSSVSALETQVGTVSESLSALNKSAASNSQTISSLTEQSETLENTVASVKASEKVARSVAVNALAAALENDDALSLPITSIKALVGETPETSRLEALNEQGIPSGKDLAASLAAFISTVRSPNAPPKDGSITERFWANARNMVAFRSSGPREGDDPLAILSRVEASVKVGNLASAKSEWEKLPADVSEKGASWLANLNTRIEAFALQNALNQKLTAEAG